MIELRRIPAGQLPAALEWQLRDFVRIVWPGWNVDNPPVPMDAPDPDVFHFVLTDGEMLISHAQVMRFEIEHAGQTYRVGGLGAVMTYPNFRKGGYGLQVVAAATRHIAASGYDFGMLFTGPDLTKFYNRNSWVRIQNITLLVGDKAKPDIYDGNPMICPVSLLGQQALELFQNARVYIGVHPW